MILFTCSRSITDEIANPFGQGKPSSSLINDDGDRKIVHVYVGR